FFFFPCLVEGILNISPYAKVAEGQLRSRPPFLHRLQFPVFGSLMKKSPLPLVEPAAPSKPPPGEEDLEELLRRHFGHTNFRGKQLEAIQAVLSGRDCFCLMPTGGGKSMCYQIPALARPGIVLVENQVMALKGKGVQAEYLSSTQTAQVREKIHGELECGKPSLRLLYVTPELIATFGFKSKLKKLHMRRLLSLVAIDEAHCVSTWGHDFRPTYRQLSSLKHDLPGVPILALTATAAPKVQKDVIESLGLHNPVVLKASFNRPNIFYEVRYKDVIDDTYADLSNLIKSSGSMCSIIYCLERSTCDDLSAHLKRNGISCAAYHAGLNNKVRSTVLDDWIASRIQVVVATVAFGVFLRISLEQGYFCNFPLNKGIDRKDVRFVCHYNIPKSMESFYQESGRAGRDHLQSKSLLYYGLDDRRRMEFILRNAGTKKQKSSTSSDALVEKSLEDFTRMVEYCEESGCRRKRILESFGEKETEFWNREDEENTSDDDISVSDDEAEVMNSHVKSKMSAKAEPMERIELLQHAEDIPQSPKSGMQYEPPNHLVALESPSPMPLGKKLLDPLKMGQRLLKTLIDPRPTALSIRAACK
ncbi:hypothetical protein Taro_030999, partial [Colocasia esculenta]|nr:hypothetical protein [Colocasia esculenta]